MRDIYLIIDDVRSAHNVGSMLRTAEGLGVKEVFLCGYTPYPMTANDDRLPHIARKINERIRKTALGAEATQRWSHWQTAKEAISQLKTSGIIIASLEQSNQSISIVQFKSTEDIALIVGNEVTGVDHQLLKLSDYTLELPMLGSKESFNVSIAAAMALFYLRNMV